MNKYFENLYKVLFEPNTAFDNLKEDTPMSVAVMTVIWTNVFLYVAKHFVSGGFGSEFMYFVKLIFTVLFVLLFWFMTALFFEFTAKAYGKSGQLRTLLTLSAYSFLPYIFIAPCELFKKFSQTGYFWGTKIEILLFVWVIFLYALSLKKTYDLKKSSHFVLIFLPLASFVFSLMWLIGSAFNLGYIYSV